MLKRIEFIAQGSSSLFGNFGPGDRLQCNAEHARHFVEEAQCARYVQDQQPAPADAAAPAEQPRKPRAKKA